MFRIDVEDIKDFKGAVEALGNLIDEGSFSIKEDGIGLHALDPSQIAMVIFTMPKEAFTDYQVDGKQEIGLNIDNFNKILARGRGSQMSLFDEENKIVVQFISGKSKKSFKIPMIDVGAGAEREPKVEHDVDIIMNAGKFKDAVKDIALVSSHITLEAKNDKLRISASGDNAEAEIEYEEGEDSGIKKMEIKNSARATFPVQYLEDMIKGANDVGEFELSLKTNAPVKIKYAVGNASFVYYLAPRIDLE